MFDVDIIYTESAEKNYYQAVVKKVAEIHRDEKPGDILIFLTGEEEIESACADVEEEISHMGNTVGNALILPLYSTLPPS